MIERALIQRRGGVLSFETLSAAWPISGFLMSFRRTYSFPISSRGHRWARLSGGLLEAGYSGDRLKAVACHLRLNKYVEKIKPPFLKKDPKGVFNYLMF